MFTRKIKISFFLILIPLLALGVFFLKNKIKTPDVPNIEISTFGHRESIFLTEKMLNYQIGVRQAYIQSYETKSHRIEAAAELMRFMLEKKVAENNSVKVAKKEIADFSEYVDKSTKAPEILEKIKQVFGDDRKFYEKLYLVPKINNQKLAAFYSRNTEIHKEERNKIERAYSLVAVGENFEKTADEIGGAYHEFEIKAENPLLSIVKTLSLDQIYSNIVENDQSFMVIKLLGQNEDSFKIAAIIVNKKPFDDWFKKEAEKVEIKILDENLKNSICAEYKQVWWLIKTCNQ